MYLRGGGLAMADRVVTVRIVSNLIPKIAAELRPRASQVVRKTAQDIAAGAKNNTTRVDTGAMKSGFQVEQTGDLSAVVFNTQDYFVHQELGTEHISPSPMLIPAAHAAEEPFKQAIEQLVKSL